MMGRSSGKIGSSSRFGPLRPAGRLARLWLPLGAFRHGEPDDLDLAALVVDGPAFHALAELYHVGTANAQVADLGERQPGLGPDRMEALELSNLFVGPRMEALAAAVAFHAERRVRFDELRFLRPGEQGAQGLERVVRAFGSGAWTTCC